MSRIFGRKDPFNDPFFTTPTGSLFGSGRSSNIPGHVDNSKGPVIEELDSDDERELQENEGVEGADEKKDEYKERAWPSTTSTPTSCSSPSQIQSNLSRRSMSIGGLKHLLFRTPRYHPAYMIVEKRSTTRNRSANS
ncbi:hypothetical protein LIER_24404 [Lithospermum erythrorhizon]|uniref:Uncharacterized protein n=1 Tax=Lithospermum erythrorhizon TaxID=34254 RepID=A0AAV3R580_LITER